VASDLRARSAAEVFDDHLELSAEHRFDDDVERNVSPECVILERRGVFHGRQGARTLAGYLDSELPQARFSYVRRQAEGRILLLEWTAEARHTRVRDGVDSYVIENGWIVAQTIRYTVEPKDG
jgi:hypothetical protein